MKPFSVLERPQSVQRLQSEEFDILIIGGGITGAGIARESALRGAKVALLEASDFASGTSSRSSKLIHGGIRYLENLEFKLVFEALSERQNLFTMAPHLVHPLRFMLPLYKGGRVGMFKMGLGMWLYDALSLFQAPELHERLSASESVQWMPDLQESNLLGAYLYSDAYMDDDRLVHETLRSAVQLGATCVSYLPVVDSCYSKAGAMDGLVCQDLLTNQRIKIKARHIISTVGPWTDIVGTQLTKSWKKILRPTKGVHLTFAKSRLPLSSAVVMAAEKRIVFAIPRHDMVIVGTTDTDFTGDPSTVVAEPADVKYLLGVIDKYFPGAGIRPEDIISSYAGVRPLVYDGSASEGKTSREHTIFTTPENVTFVAGGKYTTYRLIAEQIFEEVMKYFPLEDRVRWLNGDSRQPLNARVTTEIMENASQYVEEILELTNWRPEDAEGFFARHGAESLAIIAKFGGANTPLELEVYHAIHHTMCFHLVDFYVRRVPLFLGEVDHGLSKLEAIMQVFMSELHWSQQECQNQRQKLNEHIFHELAWRSA